MSLRVLVDAGNPGSGGYHRYLRGMLASPPADAEVTLLCSPQLAAALAPVPPAVQLLVEPAIHAPDRATRLGWWRREYPRLARRLAPAVVLHPSGIVRGDSGGAATVAVHHNIAPFVWDTYRAYGASAESVSNLVLRARLARSFQRADGVVFHAEYTRDVVSRQVARLRRTALVPNAVSAEFLEAPPRIYPDLAVAGTPVRILCVSTLHLTKHQWNVVDAVADLRADLGRDLRVTFIGGGDQRARTRLVQRIAHRDAGGFASVVDSVPAEAMAGYYADADLFVFPSSAESSPITLLEAMAIGLPVACSNRLPMPQVLGDAGAYFDPHRTETIAAALRELLLASARRRREYGERARARATYPWSRSSAQLFAFLREIAGDSPRGPVPPHPSSGRPRRTPSAAVQGGSRP